ncbi:MAG: radical SAM protein [Candidatus Latescibacterota bacterium]
MLHLEEYTPSHRAELEELLASDPWQEAFAHGLVEQVRNQRQEPGKTLDYIGTVVDQLVELNGERVQGLLAAGEKDPEILAVHLGRWPSGLAGRNLRISFLGLNVTSECNFQPRCIYCNQPAVEAGVDVEGWKRLIAEVTAVNQGRGPYLYITGGEPLLLGEQIWGEDGLVRFASQRGAAVNVNTNAYLITPEVALRLVQAGTAKLHISLDAPDEEVQNELLGGDRMRRVLQGIYNVQLARDLVGALHPEVHTNCVLTNRNLDLFPDLFRFILQKRKQLTDRKHPLFQDLFPHVIPVGGRSNDHLRPSSAGFRRFYEEVWPEVCRIWTQYQEEIGVPAEMRGVLFGYFSNPFLRVEHEGGLEAYVETSAAGRYGSLALPDYCYVAPTQGSFTPDGLQFRCGSHAIRRLLPIGRAGEGSFFENTRAGVAALDGLPCEEHCHGCALATLYINQSVARKLRERTGEMVKAAAA